MSSPAPTTPFTLAALATEINSDPINLGYSTYVQNGNLAAICSIINSTTNSGSGPVWRTQIPALQVLQTIVSADFLALTSLQLQQLNTMLSLAVFDATNTNTGAIFASIFSGKTNTLSAFNTMAQQTGCRAEVLWGIGTNITVQLLQQAGIT